MAGTTVRLAAVRFLRCVTRARREGPCCLKTRYLSIFFHRVDGAKARRSQKLSPIPYVAPDRGGCAAGSCADNDPTRNRKAFLRHLREHAFRDVVVSAPVRRPLCIGELVHVMAAEPASQSPGFVVDRLGFDEATL